MTILLVGTLSLQIDRGHRGRQQSVQAKLRALLERERRPLVEHRRLKNIQPAPAGFVRAIGCDPERAPRVHRTLLCHQGAIPWRVKWLIRRAMRRVSRTGCVVGGLTNARGCAA